MPINVEDDIRKTVDCLKHLGRIHSAACVSSCEHVCMHTHTLFLSHKHTHTEKHSKLAEAL